ncbi:Hypothetical protein SMAX5B_008634 [Scophthalmus maximus]|uniref:Uncharacterized protein n=1 Tax=Scophthalmus maximus TaxID=52904 RepID=A0A2U9CCU1_SCOMX|nr:Hypothetical protein SMAX5B_008634 [Scophthalmus maximus]
MTDIRRIHLLQIRSLQISFKSTVCVIAQQRMQPTVVRCADICDMITSTGGYR